MPQWTTHALLRASERFSGVDLKSLYLSASKAGKKTRAKVKAGCPVSWDRYMTGVFKGRYLRVTRCGIVFVVQAAPSASTPETIVTVFRLGSKVVGQSTPV